MRSRSSAHSMVGSICSWNWDPAAPTVTFVFPQFDGGLH